MLCWCCKEHVYFQLGYYDICTAFALHMEVIKRSRTLHDLLRSQSFVPILLDCNQSCRTSHDPYCYTLQFPMPVSHSIKSESIFMERLSTVHTLVFAVYCLMLPKEWLALTRVHDFDPLQNSEAWRQDLRSKHWYLRCAHRQWLERPMRWMFRRNDPLL